MAEKKEIKEEKEAPPEGEGEKKLTKEEERTQSLALIKEAKNQADRIEKGNKEFKDLLIHQEKMQIENSLGGTADAGSPETTEEQKANEAARKQLEGTGFEDYLFPEDKGDNSKKG